MKLMKFTSIFSLYYACFYKSLLNSILVPILAELNQQLFHRSEIVNFLFSSITCGEGTCFGGSDYLKYINSSLVTRSNVRVI
jgi:hypothetical protein